VEIAEHAFARATRSREPLAGSKGKPILDASADMTELLRQVAH